MKTIYIHSRLTPRGRKGSRKSKQRNKCRKTNNRFKKLKKREKKKKKEKENFIELQKANVEAAVYNNGKKSD